MCRWFLRACPLPMPFTSDDNISLSHIQMLCDTIRCVPNAPPPTTDTNNNAPSTLAAAAGKAWRALLHSMTALPRFGAAEYQCPQYRRTGHYDALAEVTRCLGFQTVPAAFPVSCSCLFCASSSFLF